MLWFDQGSVDLIVKDFIPRPWHGWEVMEPLREAGESEVTGGQTCKGTLELLPLVSLHLDHDKKSIALLDIP